MTQAQIDALQIVLNNDVIISALRDVFHDVAETNRPQLFNEDDAVIGQKYRAYNASMQIISAAFLRLEAYKKSSQPKKIDDLHI